MDRLFGTDGIRGIANTEPMTSATAMKIGQALAYILRKKGHRQRIVIGKDTRLSGYMLENALVAGICSMGGDALLVGPMPTAGIAFITSNLDVDCGMVISASHNPYEDNGIKIFSKGGFKLSDKQEHEIEDLIFSKKLEKLLPHPDEIGTAYREDDARGRYIVFLRHTFPKDLSLEGLKVVLDCANGATYRVAPTLFREMRAEVIALNVEPDGKNINLNCGTLHPEGLAEEVLKNKADIGIAFDGDGDRAIFVDERGNFISGDKVIAICAKRMKEEGRLKNNLVVTTPMSNLGLILALGKIQIKHSQSKVGDRYVLEKMFKEGAVLGGEDSGHIIFLDYHTTGDGIITALQLLSIMRREEKSLLELSKIMKTFPQVLINVKVKKKPDLSKVPEINRIIKQVEKELADKGRVLIRYSGTQALCRVMVEGPTQQKTKSLARCIANVVKKELN